MAGIQPNAADGSDRIARVPAGTKTTRQMWLGGEWMLNRRGETIPVTGFVPDPKIERQFMAHDGDGEILWRGFGHKDISEAEGEICSREVLDRLIAQEAKELTAKYKESPGHLVDEILQARHDEILDAYEAKLKVVEKRRAEAARRKEDDVLAQADRIKARREAEGREKKGPKES